MSTTMSTQKTCFSSTICQLISVRHIYRWTKVENPDETTDLPQVTDNLITWVHPRLVGVSLVEQELLTLSGAPEFTPGFSGVRVTRSLVLCKCFVDRCLPLCTFSFDHCVVCPSSIYGFWLPLWYIQTFNYIKRIVCLYKQSNQILRRSVCWTTETPFFWWCQCCLGCWEDIVVQRLIFLMSRSCTMERWRRASQRYEAIVFIRNRNIGTT